MVASHDEETPAHSIGIDWFFEEKLTLKWWSWSRLSCVEIRIFLRRYSQTRTLHIVLFWISWTVGKFTCRWPGRSKILASSFRSCSVGLPSILFRKWFVSVWGMAHASRIRGKCFDIRHLRIVSFHIRISSRIPWGRMRLFENRWANVSSRDMWHESSADRLPYRRSSLFCQFLLPMGKYFQHYRFFKIGDICYNRKTNNIHRRRFVVSVSAERISPSASKHCPFKFQMVGWVLPDCSCILIVLNNKAEFELDTQFFKSTVKLFWGVMYFVQSYSMNSLQGRSRFRAIADRRENIAFLPTDIEVKPYFEQ
jgi:hypothetical protein